MPAPLQFGTWYRKAFLSLTKGDVIAALLLSQIVYWCSRTSSGQSMLKVKRNGRFWLAKSARHWHEELGLSPKQSRRCIYALHTYGLVELKVMRFDGAPTIHLFLTEYAMHSLKGLGCDIHPAAGPNGFSPKALSITGDQQQENTTHMGANPSSKSSKEKKGQEKATSGFAPPDKSPTSQTDVLLGLSGATVTPDNLKATSVAAIKPSFWDEPPATFTPEQIAAEIAQFAPKPVAAKT